MFDFFKKKKALSPLIDIPICPENSHNIKIVDNDVKGNERKRTYVANLLSGRRMEVEIRNASPSRRVETIILYSAEEGRQARWLIVYMDRLPSDLIRSDVVSLIKAYYSEIKELDNQWCVSVDAKPDEFIDETGQKWIKAK
jgi:hypothetical protein